MIYNGAMSDMKKGKNNSDADIEESLRELSKVTGIPFSLSNEQIDGDTASRLNELLLKLKTDEGRESFFRRLLLGELSEESISRDVHRLHISDEGERMLFLLRFVHKYNEEILSVLKELVTVGRDLIIKTDDQHIAVIYERDGFDESEMEQIAGELYATLQTEAMSDVRVAYDRPVSQLSELSISYAHCFAAHQIGSLYSEGDAILPYHALGLEKLVYNLSPDAAREYMQDHFSDFDFSSLDNETQNTIRSFFENDLSIAETARELYIHRNTLVYRLDKFEKQSGLDIRRFDDAITCRIGLMLSHRFSTDHN